LSGLAIDRWQVGNGQLVADFQQRSRNVDKVFYASGFLGYGLRDQEYLLRISGIANSDFGRS